MRLIRKGKGGKLPIFRYYLFCAYFPGVLLAAAEMDLVLRWMLNKQLVNKSLNDIKYFQHSTETLASIPYAQLLLSAQLERIGIQYYIK